MMIHWLWLVPFCAVAFAVGWTVNGIRMEREQWLLDDEDRP